MQRLCFACTVMEDKGIQDQSMPNGFWNLEIYCYWMFINSMISNFFSAHKLISGIRLRKAKETLVMNVKKLGALRKLFTIITHIALYTNYITICWYVQKYSLTYINEAQYQAKVFTSLLTGSGLPTFVLDYWFATTRLVLHWCFLGIVSYIDIPTVFHNVQYWRYSYWQPEPRIIIALRINLSCQQWRFSL